MTPDRKVLKAIYFRACDLFFREKKKVSEIAATLNKEFNRDYKREAIYPMLAKARDLELVRMVPPMHEEVAKGLADQFGLDPKAIDVVGLEGEISAEYVSAKAAEVVLSLIEEMLPNRRRPIGLGLGPGRATLDVARYLGELMRSDPMLPDRCLKLHAITAGGPVDHPEFAPNSFFHLFPRRLVAGCVGLFAETLVPCGDYERVVSAAGISEAFDMKDDIDIVVSSRGDFAEKHTLFWLSMKKEGVAIDDLRDRGWVGDVQYRPYSATGPVEEDENDLRAVTLFELEDFVDMATRRGKHMVLVARSCSLCHNPQAEALRPLLEVPRLKVWSRIIMDAAVATTLLNQR